MRSLYSATLAQRLDGVQQRLQCGLQFWTQTRSFFPIHIPHVAAAQSLAVRLRQSASCVDQPRARSHQPSPRPNQRQIGLRLLAPVLYRIQQLRIYPGQPR
jgi:hypothetical protein